LTHYNPWLEFNAQRKLSSQSSTQRPYHSLLELLEEITYAPGDDGLARDLTPESKETHFMPWYPPDLQDAAVQTVLQQAEALSVQWATA